MAKLLRSRIMGHPEANPVNRRCALIEPARILSSIAMFSPTIIDLVFVVLIIEEGLYDES